MFCKQKFGSNLSLLKMLSICKKRKRSPNTYNPSLSYSLWETDCACSFHPSPWNATFRQLRVFHTLFQVKQNPPEAVSSIHRRQRYPWFDLSLIIIITWASSRSSPVAGLASSLASFKAEKHNLVRYHSRKICIRLSQMGPFVGQGTFLGHVDMLQD